MCFSCLFPSLPPHTLAAAINTPNAKSTLQAGWHKHSTILAHVSFCRGILSETPWHIHTSLLGSWGPCLPQSCQQQGALTLNALPISLHLNQIKRHFASVHQFPLSPQKLSQWFIISFYPAMEKHCYCRKTANTCNVRKNNNNKEDITQARWANSCTYTVGPTEHRYLSGVKGCHSFTSSPWNLQWTGGKFKNMEGFADSARFQTNIWGSNTKSFPLLPFLFLFFFLCMSL